MHMLFNERYNKGGMKTYAAPFSSKSKRTLPRQRQTSAREKVAFCFFRLEFSSIWSTEGARSTRPRTAAGMMESLSSSSS